MCASMRAFTCERCGQLLFFENSLCLRCGTALGFVPSGSTLVALDDAERRRCSAARTRRSPAATGCSRPTTRGPLCRSCALTRDPARRRRRRGPGRVRRRRGGQAPADLPAARPRAADRGSDLQLRPALERAAAGHHRPRRRRDHDRSGRVRRRPPRAAPGRSSASPTARCSATSATRSATTTGRSSSSATGAARRACRALFGDEREDYQRGARAPLQRGPPAGLGASDYVSAYATMHPWEDWAETFAHYLHIRDTLETAAAFGIVVAGPAGRSDPSLTARPRARGAGRAPFDGDPRRLAAADLRAQRGQPQHGPRRSLPVHARRRR